jgi:2-dehydro-3-deoxyphosphogalactonate aldolase
VAAGATGFGIGGQLYTPGKSARDVGTVAAQFVAAWRSI